MANRHSFVLLLALAIASCKMSESRNPPRKEGESLTAETVNTDLQRLQGLINVPGHPTAVRWTSRAQTGDQDRAVTAVLHYPKSDFKALLEGSERFEVAPIVSVPADVIPKLFPPEFHGKFTDGGPVRLAGTPVKTNLFEKSPLLHGRALINEDIGIVYLALFSM